MGTQEGGGSHELTWQLRDGNLDLGVNHCQMCSTLLLGSGQITEWLIGSVSDFTAFTQKQVIETGKSNLGSHKEHL